MLPPGPCTPRREARDKRSFLGRRRRPPCCRPYFPLIYLNVRDASRSHAASIATPIRQCVAREAKHMKLSSCLGTVAVIVLAGWSNQPEEFSHGP